MDVAEIIASVSFAEVRDPLPLEQQA